LADGVDDFCDAVSNTLDTAYKAARRGQQVFLEAADMLDNTANRIYDTSEEIWPWATTWSVAIGFGIFAIPLLLVMTGIFAAWPCMAYGRDKESSCGRNSWGVQYMGIAWVYGGSISAVVYLIMGAVVLVSCVVLTDSESMLNPIPPHFMETFNMTTWCGTVTEVIIRGGSGPVSRQEVCVMANVTLYSCWNKLNFLDEIFTAIGTMTLEEMMARIGSKKNNSQANDFENYWTVRQMTRTMDEAMDEAESLVGNTFDKLKSEMIGANAMTAQLENCYDGLRSSLRTLSVETIDGVYDAMYLVYMLGYCEWLKASWDVFTSDVGRIAYGPAVLAYGGMIACGLILAFFWVPIAVSMQIIWGGVGLEPGCPAKCRSKACCGTTGGRTGTRDLGGYGDGPYVSKPPTKDWV